MWPCYGGSHCVHQCADVTCPYREVYHSHMLDTAEYELDPEVWAAMEAAENETADDEGWEPLEEDFLDIANSSDADRDKGDQDGVGAGSMRLPRAGVAAPAAMGSDEDFDLEDDEEYDEASEEQMHAAIFAWCVSRVLLPGVHLKGYVPTSSD